MTGKRILAMFMRLRSLAPYVAGLTAISIVIGAAVLIDAFQVTDEFGHDLMATLAADTDVTEDRLLVVEIPAGRVDLWDGVVGRIAAAQATVIGLVEPPEGFTAPAGAPVLVGRSNPVVTGEASLRIDAARQRIARRHALSADGRPTLAAALARWGDAQGEGGAVRPDGDGFLVDFPYGPSAMPRFGAGQVMDASVAPDLLRGRVVLVGEVADGRPLLPIPLIDTPGVSAVVFHAFATGTLLRDSAPLRVVGFPAVIAVVLTVFVVAVVELVVFRLVGPLPGLVSGALLLGVLYAAFAMGGVLLPCSAMALATAATAIVAVWRRSRTRERTMRRLTLSLLSGTRERLFERSGRGEQAQWDEIAAFVTQILDLERLVVLVAEPDRPFVRERTAINCGIEDIEEKRRDYRRPPYSDALEAGALIRMTRRFLRLAGERGEVEYMVPLRFAGDVQGFWAMSLAPAKADRLDGQARLVSSIASRIAERLHRSRALSGARTKPFGSNLEDRLEVAAWYGQARQRLLQEIMDASATASIAFDLFGHVLHVNRSMSGILADAGIAAFNMTAVDFLRAMTGVDQEEARRRISAVVCDGSEEVMLAAVDEGQRLFLLALRSVGAPWTARIGGRLEMDPVKGLLCEFSDVTDLAANAASREQIAGFVSDTLNNDLQALSIAIHLLGGPHRAVVEANLGAVVDRMKGRLSAVRDLLEPAGPRSLVRASVPFDMHRLLAAVLAEHSASRPIVADLAMSSGLARGDAVVMRDGLKSILTLLAENAGNSGSISVTYRETADEHVLTASGSGAGGIPTSRLRTFLNGEETPSDRTWRGVCEFAAAVRGWGGRLTGAASPGEGLSISVTLARTDLLNVMRRPV